MNLHSFAPDPHHECRGAGPTLSPLCSCTLNPMSLQPTLKRLIDHRETLTRDEARSVLSSILEGGASDIEIAALLTALATRGETPAEIAGFVDAARAAATPIPLTDDERSHLVDTCGTGGDGANTFNISTAAALVAAAAGAAVGANLMVAKHGNRAVTSACGSADVLEALGIPTLLSPEAGVAALRALRFAFFHAPSLHPAMKAVMPVRRALGIRTIFNLVGPLANPAGAQAQVMGVHSPHLVPVVAEAMLLLGTRHAFVVHGSGLDEISISGPTNLAEISDGTIAYTTLTPEDLNLPRAPLSALQGGDTQQNAAILSALFSGEQSPRRDIVLLNAAAVLVAADLADSLPSALTQAANAIDSGAVTTLLSTLAAGRQD